MDSHDSDQVLQRVEKRIPPVEDAPFWLGPAILAVVLVIIAIGVRLTG